MKPLPIDAMAVFDLGGWDALAAYAKAIEPGRYECPNLDSMQYTFKRNGQPTHSDNCMCAGVGGIAVTSDGNLSSALNYAYAIPVF